MSVGAPDRFARASAALPLIVWVPLASGIALGVPGVLALLTHRLSWHIAWVVLVAVVALVLTAELLKRLRAGMPVPALRS